MSRGMQRQMVGLRHLEAYSWIYPFIGNPPLLQSSRWARSLWKPKPQDSRLMSPSESLISPMVFILFPSASSGSLAAKGLPLTVTAPPIPMAETLRRRARLPGLPSPSKNAPAPHPRRSKRQINVISMAAMNESTQDRTSSILSGPRGAIVGILLHLFTATVFLKIAEGWHILDALYFSVVIATTVGYGDITPVNPVSKVFVSLYAILSVALIGGLLQTLVERIADAQRNIADSASKRLLHTSSNGVPYGTAVQQSAEDDLIQSTRRAANKARLRLRATLTMFLGACVSGAFIYGRFLKASYVDLLYFLCVSMTTVGLGDIHPITRVGKAYAAVWLVLTSLGFANILSQYANLKLKERERDLAEKMLSGAVGEKMFSEIDGNNDGTLSEAEFLGYMICKLGKASPDEIRSILRRFQDLDKNGSGFITKDEVDAAWKKAS